MRGEPWAEPLQRAHDALEVWKKQDREPITAVTRRPTVHLLTALDELADEAVHGRAGLRSVP